MPDILIVDDEPDIREMLELMLKKAGYETECAQNGEVALEILNKGKRFKLLVTDVVMPEMDGVTTIMEVIKKFPNMKVLAMSGGGVIPSETYLEMADKLGACRTFAKPLNIKEFLDAVKELVG